MAGPFNADPNRPIDELLRDIAAGAERGASAGHGTSAHALAPFSALLVRLASDAEKTAGRIVTLTKILAWLTVGLFILTGALLWHEFTH